MSMHKEDWEQAGAEATGFFKKYREAAIVAVVALIVSGFVLGAILFSKPASGATVTGPVVTCIVATGQVSCTDGSTTTPPGTGGGGTTTPPPITEFEGCPANAIKSKTFYPVKQSTPGDTSNIGFVSAGQFLSIRMQVPSTAPQTGNVEMFFSGLYGGAPTGVWAISEKACDVDTPIVDPAQSKPTKVPPKIAYMKGNLTPNIGSAYYSYGGAGTGGITKTMEVGRTYYLNVRIDSCQAAGGCWFTNVKMP